jgi:hypothetical protein
MVKHKFKNLRHGTVFAYGKYKPRYLRIEDVEDFSKQRWNAVSLGGGVLAKIPSNATVLVESKDEGHFTTGDERKKYLKIVADAEILYAIKDLMGGVYSLFDWFQYYKDSDPKFAESCAWLEHVLFTKGRTSDEYSKALKACKRQFRAAQIRDVGTNIRPHNQLDGHA